MFSNILSNDTNIFFLGWYGDSSDTALTIFYETDYDLKVSRAHKIEMKPLLGSLVMSPDFSYVYLSIDSLANF